MRPRYLVLGLLWVAPASAQAPSVQLTYLGNMGVLLEGGGRRVLVDGLHRGGLAEYAAVPESLLAPLEGARAPFATLTAALTTHRHRDHFDPMSVASRLRADTLLVYGAPAETVDSVTSRAGTLPNPKRVHSLRPTGDARVPVTDGIVALRLPHNPTRTRRAENVGYLIQIGGLRVLHVGDADPNPETYALHRLQASGVDVAIVPFWYLLEADDTLRRVIGARVWVASHVPPADAATVRQDVLRRVPGALVLTTPGEQHRLR